MTTNYDQQAREMANDLADAIRYGTNEGGVQATILKKLNLASLLEDKARFDWLEKQSGFQLDNARKRSQWCCFRAGTNYEYSLWPNARTAITQAMKEDR